MKVTRVASYSVPRTAGVHSPTADQILRSDGGIVPIPYISPDQAYRRNSGEINVWIDQDPPYKHFANKKGRLVDHRDGLVFVPNRHGRYHLNIFRDTLADMRPLFKYMAMDLELKDAKDAVLELYGELLDWGEEAAEMAAEPPEQLARDELLAGLSKDIEAAGGLCLPYVDLVSVKVVECDVPFFDRFKYLMGTYVCLDFESASGTRRRIAAHASFTDSNENKIFAVGTGQGELFLGKKPEHRQAWYGALALSFMNARAIAELAATQSIVAKAGLSHEAIAKEVLARMGDAATAFLALPSKPIPNILASYRAAYAAA
jgi:hypothetical protein